MSNIIQEGIYGDEKKLKNSKPIVICRGLETQVLRVKPSARLSRSWNPSLESETQCPLSRSWNSGPESQIPETQCPESQMQQRGLAGTGGLCPTVTGTH
jgi:hypothetical protein